MSLLIRRRDWALRRRACAACESWNDKNEEFEKKENLHKDIIAGAKFCLLRMSSQSKVVKGEALEGFLTFCSENATTVHLLSYKIILEHREKEIN